MSRYEFRGENPRYRLVVGWDRPLGGYFAQVEDLAWASHGQIIDEDASIGDIPAEGLVLWIGADLPIGNIEQLQKALEPYGAIPADILLRLREDRA